MLARCLVSFFMSTRFSMSIKFFKLPQKDVYKIFRHTLLTQKHTWRQLLLQENTFDNNESCQQTYGKDNEHFSTNKKLCRWLIFQGLGGCIRRGVFGMKSMVYNNILGFGRMYKKGSIWNEEHGIQKGIRKSLQLISTEHCYPHRGLNILKQIQIGNLDPKRKPRKIPLFESIVFHLSFMREGTFLQSIYYSI